MSYCRFRFRESSFRYYESLFHYRECCFHFGSFFFHLAPKSLFTIIRNHLSRSFEIPFHDPPKYAFDRLASETDGFGKTIKFDYFDNGLRRSLIDPSGNKVNYQYDALNRLAKVSSPLGGASYQYFNDGLLKTVTNLNGDKEVSHSDYDYDPSGRIASVINQANGLKLSSYNLQYLDSSNQIKLTEQQQIAGQPVIENTTFTFGKMNRLVKAEYSNGNAAYQYDASGNRAQEDLSDKRTSEGVNGRANDDAPNKPIFDLVYDEQGRLRLVRDLTTKQELARYEYNFQGQRVKKTTSSGDVISTYDGDSLVAEYDGQLNPRANYVNGIDPIVRNDLKNGNTGYYQYNHLGSVVNLVGSGGQQLNSYRYDAWGVIRDKSSLTNSNNRLTFTAQLYDDETGFYSFGQGVRYMDASIGRFLQRDPLSGQITNPLSLNRYTYAFNSPLSFIDPTGLEGEKTDVNVFFDGPGGGGRNLGGIVNVPGFAGLRKGVSIGTGAGVSGETNDNGSSGQPLPPGTKRDYSNRTQVQPFNFSSIPTPTSFVSEVTSKFRKNTTATSGKGSLNSVGTSVVLTALGRLNQGNEFLINSGVNGINGLIGTAEFGLNLFNDPRGTLGNIKNGIGGLLGSAVDTVGEDIDFLLSPIQGLRAIAGAFRDNPEESAEQATNFVFDAGLVAVGGVAGDFAGAANKVRSFRLGDDILNKTSPSSIIVATNEVGGLENVTSQIATNNRNIIGPFAVIEADTKLSKDFLEGAAAIALRRGERLGDLRLVTKVGSDETLTIVAHGNKKFIKTDFGELNGRGFGKLLRGFGFKARDIELVVCESGCGSVAQDLANELQVNVRASIFKVQIENGVPLSSINNELLKPSEGFFNFRPQPQQPEGKIRSFIRKLFGK